MARQKNLTLGALAVAAATLGGSPPVSAAQFGTLSINISSPARVEVGDTFSVDVNTQQLGEDAYQLDVDLVDDTTCPTEAGNGVHTIVSRQTIVSGTRQFSSDIPDTIEIGEYTICAYLESYDSQPRRFTDQAPVEIYAVAPSKSRPWTLTTNRYFSQRLGPLNLQKLSLPDARFFYGPETRLRRPSGSCEARWSDIGMTAAFWNLGAGSTACGVDGRIDHLVIGGERMYGLVRTSSGLKLGARAGSIRRIYRKAKRVKGSRSRWLLKPYFSPIADGFPTSPIIAVVRGGRVDEFIAVVGGAGE